MVPDRPNEIVKASLPYNTHMRAHAIEKGVYSRLGEHDNLVRVTKVDITASTWIGQPTAAFGSITRMEASPLSLSKSSGVGLLQMCSTTFTNTVGAMLTWVARICCWTLHGSYSSAISWVPLSMMRRPSSLPRPGFAILTKPNFSNPPCDPNYTRLDSPYTS